MTTSKTRLALSFPLKVVHKLYAVTIFAALIILAAVLAIGVIGAAIAVFLAAILFAVVWIALALAGWAIAWTLITTIRTLDPNYVAKMPDALDKAKKASDKVRKDYIQ